MESNNDRRVVLVTGATGIQGGATVEQLLRGGLVKVRALTRDANSEKARRLAARGVEIAPGNFDDRASLDRALAGASAVFSVQNFQEGGVEAETRQGMALAEAAKAANIEHVVYTSVDGAERRSGVPHFESKWRIEQRIGELGLKATILRPVAFMDMLGVAGVARAAFLGLFRAALGSSKRLQLVASTDIGWFAARALEQPAEYEGKTLALAGDELSVAEMREVFQRVEGRASWAVPLPGAVVRLLPAEMSTMLRWFAEHGYQADIAALRRRHPDLLSFEQWLRNKAR